MGDPTEFVEHESYLPFEFDFDGAEALFAGSLPFLDIDLPASPTLSLAENVSSTANDESEGSRAKRRTHRKSRTGCRTCKKRRVKCDETHPRCGNCAKLALTCSFQSPVQMLENEITIARTGVGMTGVARSAVPSDPISLITGNANGAVAALAAGQSAGVEDLRMMHVYSTVVCKSIEEMYESGPIWSQVVPEVAFKSRMLMCALLVFSGTYIIRGMPDCPERAELIARRTSLRHEGITSLKLMLQQAMTGEAADAALLTTFIFTLDSIAGVPTTAQARSAGLPQTQTTVQFLTATKWVNLLHGVYCVIKGSWPVTESSIIYNLFLRDFYDLPFPRSKLNYASFAKEVMPYSIRKHFVQSGLPYLTAKPGTSMPWANLTRVPGPRDRWLYDDEDDMADAYPIPPTAPHLLPCFMLTKFKTLIVAGRERVLPILFVTLSLLDARFYSSFHANDAYAHRFVAELCRALRQFARCNKDDIWWLENLADGLDVTIGTSPS